VAQALHASGLDCTVVRWAAQLVAAHLGLYIVGGALKGPG